MISGANQGKWRRLVVHALSFSAVAALTLNPAMAPVMAGEEHTGSIVSASQTKTRFLALGIGKSVVVDFPRDVKDVLVADPKIANAVVHSAQRAYIIGAAVGQTNVVFFDSDGQQVATYDIAVKRDLNGVRTALRQTLPGIQIEGVGDGVILTGSVSSPIEAQQAGDIAARLVGGADKVVNSIVVRGRDQVMLKVNVSEVRRDIVKQMGIDLSASMNYGTAVVNFNNSNPFTAYGRPLVSGDALSASAITKGLPTVTATMRAMESAGVVRTLAEPNLTAISGEFGDVHCGWRVSDSGRLFLRSHHACLHDPDQLQEIRHLAQFHAGGAERGTDQPAGDDRSVRIVEREFAHGLAGAVVDHDEFDDHPLDQDTARRNHAGDSVGRLHGDGGPDPETDQAGRQRIAGSGPVCLFSARCSGARTSSTTRPS